MKNNNFQEFPIPVLRETLRQRAGEHAARLARSVGRLTSCDELPCLEYGEEVRQEYALAEKLLYSQQCRNAVERCIASGATVLRYRWGSGIITRTTFRKVGPNRIRVKGLLENGPQGKNGVKQ